MDSEQLIQGQDNPNAKDDQERSPQENTVQIAEVLQDNLLQQHDMKNNLVEKEMVLIPTNLITDSLNEQEKLPPIVDSKLTQAEEHQEQLEDKQLMIQQQENQQSVKPSQGESSNLVESIDQQNISQNKDTVNLNQEVQQIQNQERIQEEQQEKQVNLQQVAQQQSNGEQEQNQQEQQQFEVEQQISNTEVISNPNNQHTQENMQQEIQTEPQNQLITILQQNDQKIEEEEEYNLPYEIQQTEQQQQQQEPTPQVNEQQDNAQANTETEQVEVQQEEISQQNTNQIEHDLNLPQQNAQLILPQDAEEVRGDQDIKEEMEKIICDDQKQRYNIIPPELSPSIGCHFLGGKSLQLTNINDASRLYMYFFGTKILRQLFKKANQTLHEIYKKSNEVRDYTIDEIQVYQALKIVMGLQQNSSNFEFFLLKDLQKIPPYSQLFTNERFQFLLDCEKELNKDILNNEQLIHDFVSRSQNSQTSDQELVLISKMKTGEIIHNNTAYTQIYLCELSSSFIFGYYVVKDINQFANQALINLENFTNYNHHIYLSSEEFLSNLTKIPEFLKHKIHVSTSLDKKLEDISADMNKLLPPSIVQPNHSEIIYDKETQAQFLVKFDADKNKQVFMTTSGTVKSEKMLDKHKHAIQKVTEKLHKQLIEYRFINIRGEQSLFEELSEIAIQNSFIIYTQAKEKIDYRQFRLKLALELLSKQIQKLNQEEQLDKKQKLIDVEVQTEKVVDTEMITPQKETKLNSPKVNQQIGSQIAGENVTQPQVEYAANGNKGLHLKQKFDKQGMCRLCLQQNNMSVYTNIICQECTAQNKHQIFFCEKCFDVHFEQQYPVVPESYSKEQFSRLATLKSSLVTAPIDKMQGKLLQTNPLPFGNANIPPPIPQVNNGYNGYQGQVQQQQPQQQPLQQQPQMRRRRANMQDGYETSGPTFNSMAPQQPINQMPLKRRGPPLDDAGFRSDAPGSYIPATRGRKRMNAVNDGYQQRNDYGYNEMIGPNNMNGYGQNIPNVNGYERYQRPVDMNGYNTSDPNYGRFNNNGYNNNQAFRIAQVQRK